MPLDSPILLDGDTAFTGFASRMNPLTLEPGTLQLAENMRLDRGVAQTRKGAKRLADDVDTAAVAPLALPFTLGTDQTLSAGALTRASAVATVALTAHGFTTGEVINIRGATQTEYNGDFTITVTNANEFTFAVSGSPATPATGTIIVNDGPLIQSSYASGIYAMGVFSSPNYDNAREYVVLAGSSKAYLWRQGAKPLIKNYPGANETIEDGDDVSVVQAFNRVYVLRKAAEFGVKKTATITSSGTTATVTCTGHLYQTGQKVRIDGAEPSSYNGTYTITYVDANSFSYTLAASYTGSATGSITAEGATAFAPKDLTTSGGFSISVSTTTATVHCTAHGYVADDTVRLEGSTVPAFDGIEYRVATVATNSFTVTVPAGTASDSSATGRTVRRVKPPLYWDGGSGDFVRAVAGIPAEGVTYRRMPSVGWATYFNNRMWIPDQRDSVMISDVLDPDIFDPFFSSFRANQGSADYIVAVHPWVEGQALVFLRNSIWLAQLNEFASTDGSAYEVETPVSRLTLLTDEVGCAARKSIQTAGQFVYFLSDAGVYRLDSKLDLKLRGDTRPLSDAIADQFEMVNQKYSSQAVGRWFNNRYWLAVPSEDADRNNILLIFNSLNDRWESKDIYDFPLDDLLVTQYLGERRLFASSKNGRLFLLDENELGDSGETGTELVPVAGRIRTRRFNMGIFKEKRFLRVIADAVLPHQSAVSISSVTVNPDNTETILTQSNFNGTDEDFNLKGPIRRKAHYVEFDAVTSNGRPTLRALTVEAAGPSLPETNTRTRE